MRFQPRQPQDAQGRRIRARTAAAWTRSAAGLLVLVDHRRHHLLRVHEAHPVHATASASRRSSTGQQPAQAQLAGAHRGRQRRQGQEGRARYKDSDTPLVTDGDRQTAACRSTRTPTLKIRPRIFLEGNFFVDLQPGTPSRADARRQRPPDPDDPDGRRPCSSTRCSPRCSPNPRRDLQVTLLEGLRQGARAQADTPAQTTLDQDPDVQGRRAAEALQRLSSRTRPTRFRNASIVNQAPLGHRARRPVQADRGPAADVRRAWAATRPSSRA